MLGSLSLATLMVTSSIVDARTLMGVSDWSIRKVTADVPYCTLSRNYDTNINFKLAKNANGEGTIALDFKRNAFDLTRVYPIQLQIDDIRRSYSLRPASQGLIIIRIGNDSSLFAALQQNQNLNIQIDNENFDVDLGDYQTAMSDLNGCLGEATQQPSPSDIPVKNVETRPVVPPIQVAESQRNTEIDNLLEENRRLTEMLSTPPAIEPATMRPTSPAISAADPDLMRNLNESDKKLNELKARLAEIERNKAQPKGNTSNLQQQLVAAEAENAQLKMQVKQLQAQNLSGSDNAELSNMRIENAQLKLQMAQLEKDLIQSRQSIDPNMDTILREKDNQIEQLKKQNELLKQQMTTINNAAPEVVIKEIIHEVPMISADVAKDDAEMAMRLAEAETQAKAFSAERDEYRRLLQNERRRLREMGDIAGQINATGGKETKLIEDVKRLEAERADLVRQLEFAKTSMTAMAPSPQNDAEIELLNAKMADMQNALAQAQLEKQALQKQMEIADAEAMFVQKQLAEVKINQLADDRPETIAEELELKTMRAEIAALEAQNKMMRLDVIEKTMPVEQAAAIRQKANPSETRQSLRDRLSNNAQPRATESRPPVLQNVTASPAPQEMTALSGDEIRQLVAKSRIPLKGSIDRIDRVSGPDFAAFRWDTGFVYGSGEQSRLSDISAFDKSISSYIEKTQSRCTGSFDQTVMPIENSNNINIKTADIACVDANANGNAASILFFAQDGMFYALAHEANMDTFTNAIDMRDRMVKNLIQ